MQCDRSLRFPLLQMSKKYTHYGAIILFMYFGLRMLYDVAFGCESVGSLSLLMCIASARLGCTANDETILKDQPPDYTGDTLRS